MQSEQDSPGKGGAISWDPPGPGSWQLDRSHYPGGTTPISEELISRSMERGMRRVFRDLGTPAQTMECKFVNGFMYTRLRPLIGANRSTTKLPPPAVLRLATRLHPAFRRARTQTERTLADRPWRKVVADWHASTRPRLEADNLRFHSVALVHATDPEAADHLESLLAYCHECFELHFWLHGYDLGPIGMLLYTCEGWGIPVQDVLPALEGASPSTSGPRRALAEIRASLADVERRPTTLTELRAVSADTSAKVDDYLRLRGSLLFSRYDLDGLTLREVEPVLLSTILDGDSVRAHGDPLAVAAELRERVPAGEREVFDQWLNEARAAMDLRDDNGPHTVEWPAGLLRYALLDAGRRMVNAGVASSAEHAFELSSDEAVAFLRTGASPPVNELEARAERRSYLAGLEPHPTLGPVEPQPPLDVLAHPLPTMLGAVNIVIREMGMVRDPASNTVQEEGVFRGVGVGTVSYRGRARIATSPEEAIVTMEPGDVLIVRFTTPAYNVVLGIVSAVVTAEGGPLSHAAVLARELGIPAVIGATGVLSIVDGVDVEVDPVSGTVRVVE